MIEALNIGCGFDLRGSTNQVNWTNLDITQPADVIADLEEPLPFDSNTFDKVYAHSILEHIRNYTQLQYEIRRVLKVHGVIEVFVPNFNSPDAYGDPDHVRIFSFHSFYTMYWPGMVVKSIETIMAKEPINIRKQFPKLNIHRHEWLRAILIKLSPEEIEANADRNLWNQKCGYWQPGSSKV